MYDLRDIIHTEWSAICNKCDTGTGNKRVILSVADKAIYTDHFNINFFKTCHIFGDSWNFGNF